MLHVLLLILKILGILLLVILGIILAVILLVLLVPIRYQGDVSFDEKPRGGVLISWLLHFVTIRVNYDGSVKTLVKILWFRLFDKTLWPSEENEGLEKAEEPTVESEVDEPFGDVVSGDAKDEDKVVRATEVQIPEKVGGSTATGQSAGAEGKNDQKKAVTAERENANAGAESTANAGKNEKNAPEEEKSPEEKTSPAFEAIAEKIHKVRAFLDKEENRDAIRLLKKQIFKLIRHVMPKKIRGRVRFGFDDPSTTGQILTYISPFYGLYAESVTVEPVFDERVMEGEIHLKGRIRLGSLIWIVVRVFLNKNFRNLLKTWRRKGV